jgi:hypothetical protein
MAQGWRDVNWLPYHRFELTSPLALQAAMDALRAHVEPVKWLRWRWPSSGNDERFEGDVGADRFNVRRIIGYRNSFLPEVQGAVTTTGRHTRVAIEMRLSTLVLIFIALWCTGVVAALIGTISANPRLIWLPLLMLAFLYAMTMGAFWFEASKQERVLRRIFQAG